ncbi:MAG: DUF58 domain-containing protein [Desulfobacterales bacterium]|nr:DUF58 domain-containing protein [Desulfobacterales bacterium]
MKSDLIAKLSHILFKEQPQPLPISLKKRRIYILPTKRGALFTLVVIAMIFGSLNYNNNAGFLFAFLLSSMCMVSTFYTQKNLANLTVVSQKHTPVFAGETIWFHLAIKSHHKTRYKITAGFPGQKEATHDIPHKETVIFRVCLETKTRGKFKPQRIILSTTYPFGLFRTWVVLRPDFDYVVFPEPLPHPFVATHQKGQSEGHGTSNDPGSDDFRELITYRPGDPINRIAWKTLARGQGLWTRTFEAEQGPPVFINWRDLTTTDHEKRISQLCFLITQAYQQSKTFGLMLPGLTIPAKQGSGVAHRDQCLTALAMMPQSTEAGP